jgi:competence protein ComEA
MGERAERWLTAALLAVTLLVGVAAAWPRLTWQPVPVQVEPRTMRAQVEGAVAAPGLYTLSDTARLGDLVEAAGGLAADADRTLVDLTRPISDGDLVWIPERPPPTPRGLDPRVSINSASLEELDRLPGIGPALAARIAAARPFDRTEDLLRVRGIGPATFARLAGLIRP